MGLVVVVGEISIEPLVVVVVGVLSNFEEF